MKFTIVTGVSLLALGVSAGGAAAQCVADPAVDSGAEVTCTGLDTDGFNQDVLGFGDLDDVDLTVEDGAELTNAASDDRTIELQDDAKVEIEEDGIVRSVDRDAIKLDDDGKVENDGLIEAMGADADAVQLDKDGKVENTGTIRAGKEGVNAGDETKVENEGLISGDDDGIKVGEDSKIENSEDGVIESANGDGIDIDSGKIENEGLIEAKSATGGGIDVDQSEEDRDLEVENSGTIRGGTGLLVADGLVDPDDDPENTNAQKITNSGLIEGTSGRSLYLWKGNDSLTMEEGGTIIGEAFFGPGQDKLVLATDFFDSFSGDFAGGALFRGGTGLDQVIFEDAGLSDIQSLMRTKDGFALSLFAGADETVFQLQSWESFSFGDETLTRTALFDRFAPVAVPLPASLAMLLAALGGLGVLGRRRA